MRKCFGEHGKVGRCGGIKAVGSSETSFATGYEYIPCETEDECQLYSAATGKGAVVSQRWADLLHRLTGLEADELRNLLGPVQIGHSLSDIIAKMDAQCR